MNYLKLISIGLTLLVSCKNSDNSADAYGNFEAVETIISAEATGKLLEFSVTEGKSVLKGEKIGFIDTTDLILNKNQILARKNSLKAKLTTINAQLKVQEEQFEALKTDQERVNKLIEGGAATKKQSDDMSAQVKIMKAQLEATKTQKLSVYSESDVLQKQINQVNQMISKCYLTIPTNGTVLNKYVEPYELITMGKPLYKLANLKSIILRAYISGSQLNKIKLGDKVTVAIDKNKTDDLKYEGTVSWISENAEFTPKIIQTKEERVDLVYAMKILVKNDGKIKIGMPGEVFFKTVN
ncbi:MAG: HlyD family efflux transporter periplasmic adaptor subunit [Chlorobi bacterium]|nr:HlyD family efflux transporter periplasmic adaptor subunit [Chlorobiota bacterium]